MANLTKSRNPYLSEDFMEALNHELELIEQDLRIKGIEDPDWIVNALRDFAIKLRGLKKKRFNTIRTYVHRVKLMLENLCLTYGINSLDEVEDDMVLNYVENVALSSSESTTTVTISAIKSFFKLVVKRQIDLEEYTPSTTRESLPEYLSFDEVTKIIDYFLAKGRIDLVVLFTLLWDTGCRVGEILNLTWNDINFDEKCIIIRDREDFRRKTSSGKTGELVKRISDETVELLKKYKEVCDTDVLFTFRYEDARYHVKKAMEKLGIRKGRGALHLFRHGRFTFLAKKGFDVVKLQKFTGHKNLKILLKYIHLAVGDLHEEFEQKVAKDVFDSVLPSKWSKVGEVEVSVVGERVFMRLNGKITYVSKSALKEVVKRLKGKIVEEKIPSILEKYCKDYDKTELNGILPKCVASLLRSAKNR